MKGKLFSFEGIEGAGTTGQVERLVKHLKADGRQVLVVREPGGTKLGEKIREVVLSDKHKEIDDKTELLLFMASRAQVYREKILPALRSGKIVICDRGRDSSVVFQGMVRGIKVKRVNKLNDWVCVKTDPDLVLLLDVSVKVGLEKRQKAGVTNRLDNENHSFHKKVKRAYLKLARKNKKYWVVIDGEKSKDEVESLIWSQVKCRL